MGLREKVALTIAVIMFIQVIFVTSSPKIKTLQSDPVKKNQKRSIGSVTNPSTITNKYAYGRKLKAKSKHLSDKSEEIIRKKFNFPDVEYPVASMPRPHFYFEEANILQRNQINQPDEKPAPTISTTGDKTKVNKYNNKKYKKLAKLKTDKKSGKIFKPQYSKGTIFPEVEYPLVAQDTWKPNYWKQSSNHRPINAVNDDELNSYSQDNMQLQSGDSPLNDIYVSSITVPRSRSSKKSIGKPTPAPIQMDPIKSSKPSTPCTPLCFDTSPLLVDTRTSEKENTTPVLTKSSWNKTNSKKKKSKKKISLIQGKNDEKINTSPSYRTTATEQQVLHATKILEIPNESISNGNLNQSNTCSETLNETYSSTFGSTPTPFCLSSDDPSSTSPFKINKGDKTPTASCDNKIASIFDVINTIVSENTDNEDSCLNDNVINNNKSLESNVEEEFTTDVVPDFDENMLSVSTSTVSPLSLVDIDEAWANSVVLDPYKSVVHPDELELYYMVLP